MGVRFLRRLLPPTLTAILFYFLFSMPQTCANSVKDGIALCGNVVIPSLFLFLVLSNFVLESGLSAQIGWILKVPCHFLFHISQESVGALCMSLLGGYPIGISMAHDLLASKKISKSEAQMLCLFLFHPGPAFVIFAVGLSMLSSMRAGIILYVSNVLASFILGIVLGLLKEKDASKVQTQAYPKGIVSLPKLSKAVTVSISKASTSMLSICAWVTIFYTLTTCLNVLPFPKGLHLFCNCILEVTVGLKTAVGVFPLPIFAAILAFGGLSVHCQVLSGLTACGVSYHHFVVSRLLCAVLSAFICLCFLKFFPCDLPVFAPSATLIPASYSISAPAFFSLLFLSLLLILELDRAKEMC